MKNAIRLVLCLTLALLTGCVTPLTGYQQCALIGEVYTGSSVGSQTHVSSVGGSIYSYSSKTINPNCRLPKTNEEQLEINKLKPETEVVKKKNRQIILAVSGSFLLLSSVFLWWAVSKTKR